MFNLGVQISKPLKREPLKSKIIHLLKQKQQL